MITNPRGEHTAPGVYVSDIGTTYTNNNIKKTQVDTTQLEIDNLKSELYTLKAQFASFVEAFRNIQNSLVTSIKGKANEISVEQNGTEFTIKFANDAMFIAGED
jgi:hypothetical protein